MSDIENGVGQVLDGLDTIAREGGYRERVEALQVVADMTWFDNFGAEYYQKRLLIAQRLAEGVQESDIPDDELPREELEVEV